MVRERLSNGVDRAIRIDLGDVSRAIRVDGDDAETEDVVVTAHRRTRASVIARVLRGERLGKRRDARGREFLARAPRGADAAAAFGIEPPRRRSFVDAAEDGETRRGRGGSLVLLVIVNATWGRGLGM